MNPEPLVSVVITTYNHSRYILDAVISVKKQSYPNIELIIVDDGSTDQTKEIVTSISGLSYIYQPNQGLSSARNTGIINSKGEFILFLDADDWLLDNAIECNLKEIVPYPEIAFVSGSFDIVDSTGNILYSSTQCWGSDHYIHLLRSNYIAMHATVLYRRGVFDDFRFDNSLKACEDYDMYLRIARDRSIRSHPGKIAAYRQHETNMSSNIPLMLSNILRVLRRQKNLIRNDEEKNALRMGRQFYINYYIDELIQKKISKGSFTLPSVKEFLTLARFPWSALRIILK